MRGDVYFSEDQRWPSKSQRFGWLVGLGVILFIVFEMNLHLFAPLVAVPVLGLLMLVLVTVLTLQQRLSVRIGSEHEEDAEAPVARRFLRRAARAVPLTQLAADADPVQVIRLTYALKSPVSALSPGRRGSRLGLRERHIPMSDVERWSATRLSGLAALRRGDSVYPVGFQRDAVTIVLADGERLTLPTGLQASFLEALSAAKVASVKQERAATVLREEL